jgi:hypothetical protein
MGKSAGWPPNSFAFEVLGCEHTLKIPSVKLLAKRFGPLPTDIAASGLAARGRKLV